MVLSDIFKFGKNRDKNQDRSAGAVKALNAADFNYVAIPMLDGDPVVELRSEQLKGILDAASEDGEAQEQALLIETMKERDPRLGGLLETRRKAVLGCEYRLIPRSGDGHSLESQETADVTEAMRMLERARFHGLIEHLVGALDVGYSGSLIDWLPGGAGIRRFHPIHCTAWVFDRQGNPALVNRDNEKVPLYDRNPYSYVFHTNAASGTSCVRSGLGRKLAWLWYFKHTDMRYWLRYTEKFGIPFLISKVSKADYDDADRRAKILDDLKKIGADGAFLTTSEGGVETASLAGHDNSTHERLIAYIDRSYAISILGQLGSSEGQSGQLGNNQSMENVREDLKEDDCKRLMPIIQSAIIDPYWRFMYGEAAVPPLFVMDYARAKDVKYWAEVFTTMDQRGWRPSDSDVSAKMGVTFATYQPDEGKESTPLVNKHPKVKDKTGGANAQE
jgi:phage gp29-like protein